MIIPDSSRTAFIDFVEVEVQPFVRYKPKLKDIIYGICCFLFPAILLFFSCWGIIELCIRFQIDTLVCMGMSYVAWQLSYLLFLIMTDE